MNENPKLSNPNLPSGYESSIQLPEQCVVTPDQLPWLREPLRVNVAECRLGSGESFYLGSAISANPDLVKAAEGMTDGQRRIVDSMFYSRLVEFMRTKYSSGVELLFNPTTDFPIYALKNKGGQRAYFSLLDLPVEPNTGESESVRQIVLRLAVCDKNRQKFVMKHLASGKSDKGSK